MYLIVFKIILKSFFFLCPRNMSSFFSNHQYKFLLIFGWNVTCTFSWNSPTSTHTRGLFPLFWSFPFWNQTDKGCIIMGMAHLQGIFSMFFRTVKLLIIHSSYIFTFRNTCSDSFIIESVLFWWGQQIPEYFWRHEALKPPNASFNIDWPSEPGRKQDYK